MEDLAPLGLWLQPNGCCNGLSWVAMEFNSLGFMFLRRGWKMFTLAQCLWDGHVLHFKFDWSAMFFVKVFVSADGRLDCCMEDRSDGSSSPLAPMRAATAPPPAAVG
ncbi:heat shock cognate 70 kda protein 1 [Hordeum vulgare]|nr:heat shock cognate 70 kda protein 1 [Hordeum vulgare]